MEDKKGKRLLYDARDDAIRARMFDKLFAAEDTPEELRKKWAFRVAVLMISLEINEVEAKALAVSLIVYEAMGPVERSYCLDHGEAVRREMEWRRAAPPPSYTLPSRGAPPVQ